MKASLEPLLDTLNKPTVKLGIEYRYILIPPTAAVLVFFLISAVGAVLGLFFTYLIAWRISTHPDDRVVRLAAANLWQNSSYDPFV
jgi:hypothetical protein